MMNIALILALSSLFSLSSANSSQETSPQQPPTLSPGTTAHANEVGCLLTLDLTEHLHDEPVHQGSKGKEQNLVLVFTKGKITQSSQLPGFKPGVCNSEMLSKKLEELPPLYFLPGKQTVLKYPSRIEVELHVIPVGFAYYGIPNPIITIYRRTLP